MQVIWAQDVFYTDISTGLCPGHLANGSSGHTSWKIEILNKLFFDGVLFWIFKKKKLTRLQGKVLTIGHFDFLIKKALIWITGNEYLIAITFTRCGTHLKKSQDNGTQSYSTFYTGGLNTGHVQYSVEKD